MPYDVLDGLKILDLGIITAGASTSAMLADLGAEVLKVEGPTYTDPFRKWFADATGPNWWNESPQFLATNRNKKCICLDLKSERGRTLFLDLVRGSDVVVENFRAGVLDQLGIGYETLRRANAGIVLASISSQGATGPSAGSVSFGSTLEASSGMAHLIRYPGGGPRITGRALNYPDQVVSLFACGAILTALYARLQTGEGAHLDLSQRELTAFLVGEAFLAGGDAAGAEGTFVAGDGREIAVSVPAERAGAAAALLGGNVSPAVLAAWIAQRSSGEALATLRGLGIAAEPVLKGKSGEGDMLPLANAFVADGTGRSCKGLPIRIGGVDLDAAAPAPALGEHNREIVVERLGLSESEYRALVAEGILATAPRRGA